MVKKRERDLQNSRNVVHIIDDDALLVEINNNCPEKVKPRYMAWSNSQKAGEVTGELVEYKRVSHERLVTIQHALTKLNISRMFGVFPT